jgi:hypothetical protein
VKVYLDEDMSPIVARVLRDKGIDAVSAHEVGRVQLDDRAQLAEAAGAGRAIVTANVVDFLALAHDAVASNVEHAGIVLVPSSFRGDEFDAIANAVARVASHYPKGLEGLVVYLRRRSLTTLAEARRDSKHGFESPSGHQIGRS